MGRHGASSQAHEWLHTDGHFSDDVPTYGRIRLPIVQAWELEPDLGAFACGLGKAAANPIWR